MPASPRRHNPVHSLPYPAAAVLFRAVVSQFAKTTTLRRLFGFKLLLRVPPLPFWLKCPVPQWVMSFKITSVTYLRYRGRTILARGVVSGVKAAKSAGGLRETRPEFAFVAAGGRRLASRTSSKRARVRYRSTVVGWGTFECAHPAPDSDPGDSSCPMHSRPAKSRG
jgi:hypothetical protein